MAVNFPSTPTNGQQLVVGDKTYTYDSTGGVWNITGGTSSLDVLYTRSEQVATEDQTTFNVSYSTDYPVEVFVNGLQYLSTDYTATNGTSIILDSGIPSGSEIVINYATATSSLFNPSSVSTSIIPNANEAYDLGDSTHKFRDLYLSGNSIILGDTTISASGGELQVAATGETPAPVGGGVSGYATTAEMPLVDNALGDTAFVAENNRLYVWNGSGWYSVGLINTAPSITTGGAGTYLLAIDGTPTVITLDAEDPEGLPITWSYTVTSGSLGNTATVSQADNVFTVTPSTQQEDAGEFTITFTASDGVNIATDVNSFSLAFGPDWTTVTEQQKIQASDVEELDLFGDAIAISGDTAVVGARLDEANGTSSGSAYVFTRSGSTWTQQAKLLASDGEVGDEFGISVAIDGDTIVVGASLEDTTASAAGSVYVFTRSGSTWTEQQKIQASDAGADDNFGKKSIGISGDTIIVGAYGDDDQGSTAGAAYIFTRSGSTWTQQAKIFGSDTAVGDRFGDAVAIDGDTAVVGAYLEDYGGTSSGAAYIFTRSGSTWTEEAKVAPLSGTGSGNIGYSVAVDGDTAVVGAYSDDAVVSNGGSAYIYVRSGATWTEQTKLFASDTESGDLFGYAVDVSGDAVVVGAYFEDPEGTGNAGSVYIFTRDGTTWTEQHKIFSSDKQSSDEFGAAVSIDGDTIIVGARKEDTGGADAGAAYIFVAG